MKKILFLFGLALLMALPIAAHGQTETKVFDSTDHYLGACSLTATSTWTLTQSFDVSKFSMWYKWQTGETELPITVTKDGAPFASFTATRSACDPYQTSWCNADNAYQCLKPGGTGTVLLYSSGTAVTNTNTEPNLIATANTNTNTVANTNTAVTNNANTNTALNTNIANANAKVTSGTDDGTEDSSTMTYILIGIIAVLVVVIIVMYLQCCKKSAGK
jgi:opacity protein-like surface antigen